jgi:hypothetical protein
VVEVARRAVDKSGLTKLSRHRGPEPLDPRVGYAPPCKCEGSGWSPARCSPMPSATACPRSWSTDLAVA